MSSLPESLACSPNIPWEKQTLSQLRSERDHWANAVKNAAGFPSAKVADDFRKGCEAWIAIRERESSHV